MVTLSTTSVRVYSMQPVVLGVSPGMSYRGVD